MKSPSKNISRSLRSQRSPGRAGSPISVSKPRGGAGSRMVPGESGVESAPGREEENCASRYGGAVGGLVGGRK